jgi:flagellar basal-body rod protein FlgF
VSHGIWSATSGADAQIAALDAAANNAANASTNGYRGDQVSFKQALAGARATAASPRFVTRGGTGTDNSQGSITPTGRPLDVAIRGDGYLVVKTTNGERYTRAGQLEIAKDGLLRTKNGDAVLGTDGRTIDTKGAVDARIDPDGTVRAGTSSVGKLKVVTFAGPLAKEGSQVLRADASSGTPTVVSVPALETGALESSNVSVVHAMVDMVTATRAFDACEKVIEAFSDADRRAATTLMGRE